MSDLKTVTDALASTTGDAAKIASVGLSIIATLLRKNADYGSSVFKSPTLKPSLDPADAILVRMSDKVNRIATLTSGKQAMVDESLDETVTDLGGYSILWLCSPTRSVIDDDDSLTSTAKRLFARREREGKQVCYPYLGCFENEEMLDIYLGSVKSWHDPLVLTQKIKDLRCHIHPVGTCGGLSSFLGPNLKIFSSVMESLIAYSRG